MAEAASTYEQYAHSTLTLRRMGHVAARTSGEIDVHNVDVTESYVDFETAIGENLATDSEFGEKLIFNQLRRYEYIGGQTRTAYGRPVVELIQDGARSSRMAAQYDERMLIQAERDEADIVVAETVDSLNIGEMYAVVSLEPKDALQADRKFWESRGYRDGMAVLQVYYRLDEETMLAGAYSIKQSDKRALSRIWAGYGVHIPTHTADSKWITYGIRRSVDSEDAEEFGKGIIKAHQAEIGDQNSMMSVTEFIKSNRKLVMSCFQQYMAPLSESLVKGRAHVVIQDLARQILCNGAKYSIEENRSLIRLANGGRIGSREIAVMEEKIRYAVVEELRKLLKTKAYQARTGNLNDMPRVYVMEQVMFMQNMGHVMAGNIANGMAAGRSYGGCTPAEAQKQEDELSLGNATDLGSEQQDVFGGKGKLADDKYGSRTFKCPKKGCLNTRPKNTLIPRCQKCGADVRC